MASRNTGRTTGIGIQTITVTATAANTADHLVEVISTGHEDLDAPF
jgi:hypothetical protein